MYKSIRQGLGALGAAGLMASGVVLAGPGVAVASTGDWGYGSLGHVTLHPGVNAVSGAGLGSAFAVAAACFSANGCQYDPTMVIVGNAYNGTRIPSGRTFTLDAVQGSARTAVGTCTTNSSQVICRPSVTGSVVNYDGLLMVGTLNITVPKNLPNGTAVWALNWRDNAGETGNFTSNDTLTEFTVINPTPGSHHHHGHHHARPPREPEDFVPNSDAVVSHHRLPVGGAHAGEGGSQTSSTSATKAVSEGLGGAAVLIGAGLGLRRHRS